MLIAPIIFLTIIRRITTTKYERKNQLKLCFTFNVREKYKKRNQRDNNTLHTSHPTIIIFPNS